MNKKTTLIVITSITATLVALCAAYFSVTGISKLFAGASLSIIIMATALELGKIVGISFLYQYWNEIPKTLKFYLTSASIILMIITSMGIYGYLSAAYQVTADQLSIIDQQSSVIDMKKSRYQEELDLYIQERERLSTSISDLNKGLAGNVIQYVDRETGQLITSTSSATRIALQEQLKIATQERTTLADRIQEASDSIGSLEIQKIDLTANSDAAAEVGPLRYISDLTGWSMNKVVNVFALLIVFVFDPLAISLVVSVNFLVKNRPLSDIVSENSDDDSKKEPYQVYTPTQPDYIKDSPELMFHQTPNHPTEDNNMDFNQNGIPEWMERDFDWDDTGKWIDNPYARAYKRKVIDNHT